LELQKQSFYRLDVIPVAQPTASITEVVMRHLITRLKTDWIGIANYGRLKQCFSVQDSLSLRFKAIFQVDPGYPVFIEAKDDGSGDPVFLQAGCPSCRPTNSVKALKGKYHIPWSCLPQAHLGSSNFVSNH